MGDEPTLEQRIAILQNEIRHKGNQLAKLLDLRRVKDSKEYLANNPIKDGEIAPVFAGMGWSLPRFCEHINHYDPERHYPYFIFNDRVYERLPQCGYKETPVVRSDLKHFAIHY